MHSMLASAQGAFAVEFPPPGQWQACLDLNGNLCGYMCFPTVTPTLINTVPPSTTPCAECCARKNSSPPTSRVKKEDDGKIQSKNKKKTQAAKRTRPQKNKKKKKPWRRLLALLVTALQRWSRRARTKLLLQRRTQFPQTWIAHRTTPQWFLSRIRRHAKSHVIPRWLERSSKHNPREALVHLHFHMWRAYVRNRRAADVTQRKARTKACAIIFDHLQKQHLIRLRVAFEKFATPHRSKSHHKPQTTLLQPDKTEQKKEFADWQDLVGAPSCSCPTQHATETRKDARIVVLCRAIKGVAQVLLACLQYMERVVPQAKPVLAMATLFVSKCGFPHTRRHMTDRAAH